MSCVYRWEFIAAEKPVIILQILLSAVQYRLHAAYTQRQRDYRKVPWTSASESRPQAAERACALVLEALR